jgi:hypothetical protein
MLQVPALMPSAHSLQGDIQMADGDRQAAVEAYRALESPSGVKRLALATAIDERRTRPRQPVVSHPSVPR